MDLYEMMTRRIILYMTMPLQQLVRVYTHIYYFSAHS